MKKIEIEKLIIIDESGMPKPPSVRQLMDKDILQLYARDNTPDKRTYIAECGVIYYMGDPKSPAKQKGLSDEEALREAIENFNLPKTYRPDDLVKKITAKYYRQNITEAGVAIEVLNQSVHLISIAATKINNLLSNLLENAIEKDDINAILVMMDSVNKRIDEIPSLTKALATAYENLRNEEENQLARGGKTIMSSMDADEDD